MTESHIKQLEKDIKYLEKEIQNPNSDFFVAEKKDMQKTLQFRKAELEINKNDLKALKTGDARYNDPVEQSKYYKQLGSWDKSNIRAKEIDKIIETRKKESKQKK